MAFKNKSKKDQLLCYLQPIKYMRWCKLPMQVRVASCQSKFEVHEVMSCVADLKVHQKSCTGNVGLQRYTELSSIRDMSSGEPAYRIASRIFARFANFLEPVIVLKIDKFPDKIYLCFNSPLQPLFPVKYMWFPLDARICFRASGPSKSKNINYWKIHS